MALSMRSLLRHPSAAGRFVSRATKPPGEREPEKRRRGLMPTYVILIDWTDEGIRNVRSTVEQADRADRLAQEKYGARMSQLYWTVGPHDLVAVAEMPEEETATAFALEVSSSGSVRTTTMRAYDREEMSGIIGRMGPSPGA